MPDTYKYDICLHAVDFYRTIGWSTSCNLWSWSPGSGRTIGRWKAFERIPVRLSMGAWAWLGCCYTWTLRHVHQGLHRYRVLVDKRWSAVGLWSIWNYRSSGPKITAGHDHSENRVVFGVGLFHGMAGTGHLLGVLPSLLLSQMDAAIYLAMYFVSAIGAMMGFGWLLSKVVSSVGSLRTWTLLTATASIGVGLYWILVQTA